MGQNVRNWPLAAVTLDRVGAAAIGGAADQNVALDSGSPRRSRRGQGDGERVASEHHEGDQPSDRLLAVRAEQFRHVADGRGLGLDSAALRGQGRAFGLQGCPRYWPRRCAHWRGPHGPCAGLRRPTGRCWSGRALLLRQLTTLN